jgi:hypothetical protein
LSEEEEKEEEEEEEKEEEEKKKKKEKTPIFLIMYARVTYCCYNFDSCLSDVPFTTVSPNKI